MCLSAQFRWLNALTIALLLLFTYALPAQDTSALQIRKPDHAAIEKYRSQAEFEYETAAPEQLDLFSLIMHKLGKLFRQLFSAEQEVTIYRVLVYALMIVSVLLIVLNLLGIDVRRLFVTTPQAIVSNVSEEENIREMNLDDLIAQAFSAGLWRLAIRFQYLKTLRLLTDNELIRWQPGKTNMDYYYELKNRNAQEAFLDVTSAFENAWYGNATITESDYLKTRQQFENFYGQIKQYR